jgi:circadian clock protein KaiC
MSEQHGHILERLSTGVPGLDQVLGGGLPEFSLVLIAGSPGTGKTTLAQQILFSNATPERPALYFTVIGEPTLKMLAYQQQFSFFDVEKVGRAIHFVNLSEVVLTHDLAAVRARILAEVEKVGPAIVVVDSFRTVVRAAGDSEQSELEVQAFLHELGLDLTSQRITSFLIGEYTEAEVRGNPIFTVADGIFWLYQKIDGNSSVRKLQVMKLRGQASVPGLHPFRITDDGIRVFPRISEAPERGRRRSGERVSTGISGLDDMMSGGIPAGDAVLVAGPSGSGKTLVGTQFLVEGLRRGEAGVIAMFEEYPEEYLQRAKGLGVDMREMIEANRLRLLRLRPLDLSVDEVLQEIQGAVAELGATRVVIDSLSGFEVGLAPTFREEIRESLYRLVAVLTSTGVTILMTVEVAEAFAPPRFSPHALSFLTDDIIMQRFVELNGYIHSVMGVVKMRRSTHSRALRTYQITDAGITMGTVLRGYQGLVTGVPSHRGAVLRPGYPGLTATESEALQALMEIRTASLDELQRQTGLPAFELRTILDRLLAMRYVVAHEKAGEVQYHYQSQPGDKVNSAEFDR